MVHRWLAGKRAVVVASTGGHLTQATRWADRVGLHRDSVFISFDSPQSRELLEGRNHRLIDYVAPRDMRGIIRSSLIILREARRLKAEVLFSTGAGVALGCIPAAWLARCPFLFLESVSRFDGPSTTGRLMAKIPGIQRGCQHSSWATTHWPYAGSLLDDYTAKSASHSRSPFGPRKVFVSLGTIRPYRFDRLIDRVGSLLTPADDVVWQLGATMRTDLPGEVHTLMSPEQFRQAALDADVVVIQAGVGSILELLEIGVSPVVVPRRAAYREHVDDHQTQVANALDERGLITAIDAARLERSHLDRSRPTVVAFSGLTDGPVDRTHNSQTAMAKSAIDPDRAVARGTGAAHE